MPTTQVRKSDRVSFRMPVEVSWSVDGRPEVTETAFTLLVSRNGGVLQSAVQLPREQELTLRRQQGEELWRIARARVIAEIDREPGAFLYAIAMLEPRTDFWDIDFPPVDKAQEALARLLMECSFCQRREVVYLNEMELRSFEARRCVARVCGHCGAPSVWIEAVSDVPQRGVTRSSATQDEKALPPRNRVRVKARVLACIRRRGFQEEVAVCEDLSKGGLSFRSRNHYPEGTRLEVAVPFTPGAGAIFVPIRIVFSQALPSAGLYRHGAAYCRVPGE